jgi:hypothetical protein
LRTGSFTTDTDRAAKSLQAFQKKVEAVGTAIGVGLVAGVGLATAALQSLVGAAGDFKDLEEQTGALAADLASLAIPAAVAGKSVADLATDMNRLTKNLSGVDDDSKAAGAALAALGVPIEKFKALDPVGQIDALSAAFNGFADGSQKTAVAMALFGKNGAAMLNVFKELEAEGGRQKILTQEQIELADEYSDKQKKLTATIKAYAESSAVDVLPAINDLTAAAKSLIAEFVGIDEQGKKLAGDSQVKQFAETAADALAFLVDSGQGVARVFQTIGVYIGGTAAATAAVLKGEFAQAKAIAADARADIDRILSEDLFSQRLKKLREAQAAGSGNQSAAETARLNRRPSLQFSGAVAKTGADKQSEAERYLETLTKQNEALTEQTVFEKAVAEITSGRLKGLNSDLEAAILARAGEIDLTKQELALEKARVDVQTSIAQADLRRLDSIQGGNDKLREEIDLLGKSNAEQTAYERQKIRITKAEKEATLAKLEAQGVDETQLQVLQAEIAALTERERLLGEKQDAQTQIEGQKNAKELGKSYEDTMSQSIADGILDGTRRGLDFTDIFIKELKAQFSKAILQPIIEPIVRAQNEAASSLINSLLGAFSGSSSDYRGTTLPNSLRGGAATGTNLVERDMVTLLHKGEAVVPKAYNPSAGGTQGLNVTVNNSASDVVQATASKSNDGNLEIMVRRLVRDENSRDISTGAGPLSRGLRGRGINLDGGLAKRA